MLCPECEEGSMHLKDLRTEERRGRHLVCNRCGHVEEARGLTLAERALRPASPYYPPAAATSAAAPFPLNHDRPGPQGPSPTSPPYSGRAPAVYPITVAEEDARSSFSSILPRASPATPGGLRC